MPIRKIAESAEVPEFEFEKPIIAVTMATSRQGLSVVRHLSRSGSFNIRAIVRNPKSQSAIHLSKLSNVRIVYGNLLDKDSLISAFKDVYGIFGNTTPTTGWKVLQGSMNINYELEQGKNLVEAVKEVSMYGSLNHFIFSSICKPKNPLKVNPAPGHFASKWAIEDYIKMIGIKKITSILRPASYFENFNTNFPGLVITKDIFPGIVKPSYIWQTVAVDDIGLWTSAIFSNPRKFLGCELNLATEEKTGFEMAALVGSLLTSMNHQSKYWMIPRNLLKLIERDLAIMADWIERAGYGADIPTLTAIANEVGIEMTSLSKWLRQKTINNKKSHGSIEFQHLINKWV